MVREHGQTLEAWLRDGAYEVTWTCRRPSGDTVVMLRSRPPRQPGVCPSIFVSLRDPRDLALLRRLRAREGEEAPIVAPSPEDIAPLRRHLSPRTLVRGLFGWHVQEVPPPEVNSSGGQLSSGPLTGPSLSPPVRPVAAGGRPGAAGA